MTKEGPDVLENADATSTEARRTSQTLYRGLQVLKCVAHLPRGGTATELANATGLERTVVHRLLNTLVASGFAEHTTGGVYRLGPEARALAALAGGSIAEFAQSRLQSLADRYAGTAMLCMAESDAIVAVAVAVPTRADSHLAYRRGSRHPIDRGAGARAILAGRAARPEEAPEVTAARAAGWVIAHGEVEAGAHAVAAPVSHDRDTLDACIMFVSHRPESVLQARDDVVALAAQVREYAINDGRATVTPG